MDTRVYIFVLYVHVFRVMEFRFIWCLVCVGCVQALVPVYTGILVPINVPEGTLTETLLDTLSVTDPDGGTITSCTHVGDTGQFDLRQDAADNTVFYLYLVTNAGLDFDVATSYTLTLTCTDAAAESADQDITIDITPNQAPKITPPSDPVSVGENESTQRALYILNVTDAEDDAILCDVTATTPPTTAPIFGVWNNGSDTVVYLLEGATLDHSVTASYVMTLVCSDDFGSTTSTQIITVVQNSPPTFDNLPVADQPFNARSTQHGNTIYTVSATDPDSVTVSFSMTANPATPDLFAIDSISGEIVATRDLIYAINSEYELTVSVSDTKATTSEILRVVLTNVNTVPTIVNLPDTITVSELAGGGTSLFTITTSDPDTGDTVNVTYDVRLSSETDTFTFNYTTWTLHIASGTTFDYESIPSYDVDFMAYDGKATSPAYTLTIDVIDVNEPCQFDKDVYHVTVHEANNGFGRRDPGFVISDPDSRDTYTLTLQADPDAPYFRMDPATGEITFGVNYDVDNNVHPYNVTLVVQCTDAGGETGTATVSITVEDVNDNRPEFGKTGYVIYADQYDSPGDTLATLSAGDIDSGDNSDLEYTWSPIWAGSTYYRLATNGEIILQKGLAGLLTYGDTYRFVVTARDQGDPRLSSTTTVDIVYREATTTTTATTLGPNELSFLDVPGNVAFVVLAVILGVVLLSLAAYLAYRYMNLSKVKDICSKICRKNEKRAKIKPKPDPKSTVFDFWNNDDMIHRQNEPFSTKTPTSVLPQPAPVQ